jgi:hypothetical protein
MHWESYYLNENRVFLFLVYFIQLHRGLPGMFDMGLAWKTVVRRGWKETFPGEVWDKHVLSKDTA